jgi:hypothetical protein
VAKRISGLDVTAAAKRKTFDLNGMLGAVNLLVLGLTLYRGLYGEFNEYIDEESILLAVTLSIETQLALLLERKWRDPFVILLAFEMIFYYSLRIFTLTIYPYSEVFDRFSYTADDTNYALIFMIIANLFIYAGLYAVKIRHGRAIDSTNWKATSPGSVVLLIAAAIVFVYFRETYWTEDNIPRALNFLVLFLTPQIVILMTLSYYMLFRNSLSKKFAVSIAVLIVLEIVVHTLFGSRSALVGFVQAVMLVILATSGRLRISRKVFWLGVVSVPFMVVLLIGSFAISTYNRAHKDSGGGLDVGRSIEMASEAASALSEGASLDVVLPPILARVGFFDYSAEIIAHRAEYSTQLNLTTYGKSIVDNLLTPGFDVYDQPKIAQSLQYVYRGWGEPLKSELGDFYQSDQMGVYGEFYALFAYACLPLLFLAAYLLKLSYVRLHDGNPFRRGMKRIIVLTIFVQFVRSFGVDWTIVETLPLIAAMYMYRPFFATKRVSVPEAVHSARLKLSSAVKS